MKRLLLATAGALFAVGVAAQPLSAQVRDQVRLPEALAAADDEGDFLRLTTTDGRTTEGYVRDLDDRIIRLGGGLVELQTIERVEVRRRHRPAVDNGAIVGGLVGGVGLGLLGLAVAAGLCDNDCTGVGAFAATAGLVGAMVGAGFGALLGYSIDPGETEWVVVWPS